MGIAIDELFGGIYKGKKVLITGNTGFKGSWLSIWLNEMGAEVFGYSLPARSRDDNFVKCNLNEHIKHHDGDIRSLKDLKAVMNSVKPDIAFHLAAQAIVIDSYDDPHYTFETNLMGVVNFFEAVRATPSVKAAVNITSDKCYQNNEWHWGYRENDPMGGKDPYSASKGCSELITQSYINSFFNSDTQCSVASARAGNVIGGGDWASYRIVPDLFRALKGNTKMIIRNPDAIRPWQLVLEPLSGYLLLGGLLYKVGKAFSGAWNFGPTDNNTCSVKTLIDNILRFTSYCEYAIPELMNKPHEARILKLDISKANALMDWLPSLSFDQTIKFTAKGYLDEINGKPDLYGCRVDDIKSYMNTAAQKRIAWAQDGHLIGSVNDEN